MHASAHDNISCLGIPKPVLEFSLGPMYSVSLVRESNLPASSVCTRASTQHPMTCKSAIDGETSCHTSYGMMLCSALVGVTLAMVLASDRLYPEFITQPSMLQHAASELLERKVASLCNAIVLGGVGGCGLILNSIQLHKCHQTG
jgi:hypothetical protein